MFDYYELKHRNDSCGILSIDKDAGSIEEYRAINREYAPFLGNADTRLMKKWWEARAVPSSRRAMSEIIRNAGCDSGKDYLAKNLALSMTDSYWICPVGETWTWEEINLYENARFAGQFLPYHNVSSYDPNASLGGQMEKYWDLSSEPPQLVKSAHAFYGQQAINEKFASWIHERQSTEVPYVRYDLRSTSDRGMQSVCPSFTSYDKEFVPAMEVLDSVKIQNDQSLYDAYIKICSDHGIDPEYMQACMDYMVLTDFVISNADEHLMNFGVIRDADTRKIIGPAPIFDSGNSMFFSDERIKPFSRLELLERKITGFHSSEERMLQHVKDRMCVREDLLPSPEETREFFLSNGLPEQKAAFIAGSYAGKIKLLRDFQRGVFCFCIQRKRKG